MRERATRVLRRLLGPFAPPRPAPPPRRTQEWAVGIYTGASPLALAPAAGARNPVLGRDDVTDVRAAFVADPFLHWCGDRAHLFVEVLNAETRRGEIAVACSDDGLHWTYERVVLAEPFHLSFPQVFCEAGEHFLVPESHQREEVRLYRAVRYPYDWTLDAVLLAGRDLVDPAITQWDGRWWMFASEGAAPYRADSLRLFHADALRGPWREHVRSPIVAHDRRAARPAGRVLAADGRLLRFAQDCSATYGASVRAFEITALSPTTYAERPLDGIVLDGAGAGWNADGMHHLDALPRAPHGWLAAVDGFRWRVRDPTAS